MDVYEYEESIFNRGQEITIEFVAYSGELWNAKIDFVSPLLNEKTRTLEVRATLENTDSKLKPGMTGEGQVSFSTDNEVLAIPKTAIIDTGKRQVVWIALGDDKYIAKTVEVGMQGEDYIEIKSGLNEGDKVVFSGNFLLDAQAQLFGGYNIKQSDPSKNIKEDSSPIDTHKNH